MTIERDDDGRVTYMTRPNSAREREALHDTGRRSASPRFHRKGDRPLDLDDLGGWRNPKPAGTFGRLEFNKQRKETA